MGHIVLQKEDADLPLLDPLFVLSMDKCHFLSTHDQLPKISFHSSPKIYFKSRVFMFYDVFYVISFDIFQKIVPYDYQIFLSV